MTARLRLGNFGPATLAAGAEVRLDLAPLSASDSYRFDPAIAPEQTFSATVDRDLEPGDETAVEFKFAYPAKPMWMRVRLDPNERIDEFCEANNESIGADRRPADPARLRSQGAESRAWRRSGSTTSAR